MCCADLYERAGVALTTEPLVGVGSVCRRQASAEITGLLTSLAALGLRLRGFGVKTRDWPATSTCWPGLTRWRAATPWLPSCTVQD
ncbi:MAG: DUF7221 family queuine tRNA-ribosyltransferase-like protein [Egibacteraceae bacterium]